VIERGADHARGERAVADSEYGVSGDLLGLIDPPEQEELHGRRDLEHGIRRHGLEVAIGRDRGEAVAGHADGRRDADAKVRAATALLEHVDLERVRVLRDEVEPRRELAVGLRVEVAVVPARQVVAIERPVRELGGGAPRQLDGRDVVLGRRGETTAHRQVGEDLDNERGSGAVPRTRRP
jgi:hypothetical protein